MSKELILKADEMGVYQRAILQEWTGAGLGISPDWEVWTTKQRFRWDMIARLSAAERRGEVIRQTGIKDLYVPGVGAGQELSSVVVVVRLKPARRSLPWILGAALLVLIWLTFAAFLLYAYRWQIGVAVALAAALLFMLTRLNHRGACPGLHCAGCRG